MHRFSTTITRIVVSLCQIEHQLPVMKHSRCQAINSQRSWSAGDDSACNVMDWCVVCWSLTTTMTMTMTNMKCDCHRWPVSKHDLYRAHQLSGANHHQELSGGVPTRLGSTGTCHLWTSVRKQRRGTPAHSGSPTAHTHARAPVATITALIILLND